MQECADDVGAKDGTNIRTMLGHRRDEVRLGRQECHLREGPEEKAEERTAITNVSNGSSAKHLGNSLHVIQDA